MTFPGGGVRLEGSAPAPTWAQVVRPRRARAYVPGNDAPASPEMTRFSGCFRTWTVWGPAGPAPRGRVSGDRLKRQHNVEVVRRPEGETCT